MSALITQEELLEWTGFKRKNALEEWLKQNDIPYLTGKDARICATVASVLNALNKHSDSVNPSNYVPPDQIEF